MEFLAEMMIQTIKTLSRELNLGSMMKFRMEKKRKLSSETDKETIFTKLNGTLELSYSDISVLN